MTRGRKPLPRETLALRGTLRNDRERPASVIGEAVQPNEVGKKCQVSGLKSATKRAREIYWSTVRKVSAQGMLDESFCQQLFIYSVELDLLLRCEEDIRKNGMYIIVETKKGTMALPNPAVKQLHAAAEKVLKIGSNFGFSPIDRQRLKAQAEDQKDKKLKGIVALLYGDEDEKPDEQ